MKHEIENLNGHFKKISIEIPAEAVSQEFESAYKEIQKQAEIKGFRKGKVPLNIIEQNYGESARKQVGQNLVEQNLGKALKENSLQPVAQPDVQFGPASKDKSYSFTANFENMPPVDLKDYTGFKATKEEVKIEQAEIDKAIGHIRDRLAETTEALFGTEAREGQVLKIDHHANEAGKDVPEAHGHDTLMEIGKGFFGEEFDKKITGVKAEETRVFSVTYPKDSPFFQGRTIEYKVKVKAILNKKLPELNDDFAKKVGLDSIGTLTARIEEDLKAEKQSQQLNKIKEEYVEWLVEKNPVDVPETLLQNQMQYLASEAAQNLAQMGLEQDKIEGRLEEWKDDMHKRSEKQVKASLLLSVISEKENIQAGEDEVRNEIMKVAQQTQRKPQEILEDFQSRGLVPSLLKQLTELKTLETMARKAVEST